MFYRDNWITWSYDGRDYGNKTSAESIFDIRLKKISRPIKSYEEELYENARAIRDLFTEPLCLLFSGGIDSEVILRVYDTLKIPIKVYIVRYENDLNIRDFNFATKFCSDFDVDYTIIDFNLQKFFEQDAYHIWKKVYCGTAGRLPHMKFAEYVDGIPIFGSGEPYWVKREDDVWVFEMDEDARAWSVYYSAIGKVAICDWYEYSPEITLSYMKIPGFINLINNRIPGKLSTNSSKSIFHKEIWPDIEVRPKLVGFEGSAIPGKNSKPEFMLEFERQYITNKIYPRYFYFTANELIDLI